MDCIKHAGTPTLVRDSRYYPGCVRRRRECPEGHRFTTYEFSLGNEITTSHPGFLDPALLVRLDADMRRFLIRLVKALAKPETASDASMFLIMALDEILPGAVGGKRT